MVADGAEALEHMQQGPPTDLILLDMMVAPPAHDGWHLLEMGQRKSAFAAVPIIIVTGLNIACAEWAADFGAAGCVKKPVDTKVLSAEVRRCCGLHRHNRVPACNRRSSLAFWTPVPRKTVNCMPKLVPLLRAALGTGANSAMQADRVRISVSSANVTACTSATERHAMSWITVTRLECPNCHSLIIQPSRVHGVERFFPLVLLRAYRCLTCYRRFWRFGWRPSMPGRPKA